MIVRSFEILILLISLIFWKYSKIPILPPHESLSFCVSVGVSLGVFITLMSILIAGKTRNKSIKRFLYEFHSGYLKKGKIESFVIDPLLISVPEELFFRGPLLPSFGFLIANLLFSLVHIFVFTDKIITFISIFIYGTLFSVALYLTNSLLAPLIAHYLFTLVRIYYFPKYIGNNRKSFSFINN